jgi:hypothetical protein
MRFAGLACLACAFVLSGLSADAQSVPRTADGHPEFQVVWSTKGLTPMERIPAASAVVVDDAEARKLVGAIYAQLRSKEFEIISDPNAFAADVDHLLRVNNTWRASIVVDPPDGKLPLTEEGRRLLAEAGRQRGMLSDPEVRPHFERCIAGSGTPPMWMVPADNIRQIVQTRDHVVIYTQEGGDTRIIRFGAKHGPDIGNSYLGDSIAHWEGDELVVETVYARHNAQPYRTNPQVVRPQSRIVERFRLVSRNEVLYRFTIEDPVVYTRAWTGEYSLHREAGGSYEFGCHEGNYSLTNILRAARIAEARK